MRIAFTLALFILCMYELSLRMPSPRLPKPPDVEINILEVDTPQLRGYIQKPKYPKWSGDSLDPNLSDFDFEKAQEDPQATDFYKD